MAKSWLLHYDFNRFIMQKQFFGKFDFKKIGALSNIKSDCLKAIIENFFH